MLTSPCSVYTYARPSWRPCPSGKGRLFMPVLICGWRRRDGWQKPKEVRQDADIKRNVQADGWIQYHTE